MGNKNILLIEDEDILRETSKAMLISLGYSVITAENGEVGLKVFKDNNEQIDLIILDMIMPVMGGREAFTKLREIDPNIPIIICSGFTKDGDADYLKKNGADMFIHKPFRLAELSNIVAKGLKSVCKDN